MILKGVLRLIISVLHFVSAGDAAPLAIPLNPGPGTHVFIALILTKK